MVGNDGNLDEEQMDKAGFGLWYDCTISVRRRVVCGGRLGWGLSKLLAAEERIIFSARREWMTLDVYSFAYTFTEYVSRNNLSVILDAEYVQGIDYETANRRLGLPNIGTLRWVGRQPPTNVLRIPGLDEVTVGIRLT